MVIMHPLWYVVCVLVLNFLNKLIQLTKQQIILILIVHTLNTSLPLKQYLALPQSLKFQILSNNLINQLIIQLSFILVGLNFFFKNIINLTIFIKWFKNIFIFYCYALILLAFWLQTFPEVRQGFKILFVCLNYLF